MRRGSTPSRSGPLAALFLLCVVAGPVRAATFTFINLDSPGEGFNDPTPVSPVGGNPGTTLGEQRLIVFQAAMETWGAILPSDVPIRVEARFDPLTPCDAGGGVLGSAGAVTVSSDFTGAPLPDTWYPIALASKLNGTDLGPGVSDITARFNSDVDGDVCLGTAGWYYGLDHDEGTDEDFLAVVLHELGHGLGFQTFTNTSTGGFVNGRPDIYARFLFDRTLGLRWDQMTNNQRKNSADNTGQLVWDGFYVRTAAPQFLGPAAFFRVDSPPAIAGDKEFGTAEFGPPAGNPPLQGNVVLAIDGVGTTSDACEPLLNPGQLAGAIALIDRGTCTFVEKAQAAQAAGAIAVVIGNNTTGPPPGMSGNDPTITIPVVSITQDDATDIKGQLGGGVTVTIGGDPLNLAGADPEGRPRIYAPNPLEPGSSVSHFDEVATPNLLMEPFINTSLTSNVDLTQYLFVDIGWLATASGVAESPTPPRNRAWGAPNPFSASISIWFHLVAPGETRIEVFDVRGSLVKRLSASRRTAGLQSIDWDGTDSQGRRVAPGVYFWSVRSPEERITGRMVRVD